MRYSKHDSPVGALFAVGDGASIAGLYLPAQNRGALPGWVRDDAAFGELWRQLDEYFAGSRLEFDLLLAPAGTALQREIWMRLRAIPAGSTMTYAALALDLGRRPGSARAVGNANARNPISIVIPCHRLVGSDGRLTGYAGGLAAKEWLLRHERALLELSGTGRPATLGG